MKQKYIVVNTEKNKPIKLCFKEQDDGTWSCVMLAETMQDIETIYPDVIEQRD